MTDFPAYPFTVYRFRVIDPISGKTVTTRHEMTEEVARAQYQVVERLEHTARVITGPSESTSGFLGKR